MGTGRLGLVALAVCLVAGGGPSPASAKTTKRRTAPRLRITVVDARTRTPIPAKLRLRAPGRNLVKSKWWDDGGGRRVHLIDGTGSIRLSRGRYRVTVSRGPEWTHFDQSVYVGSEGLDLEVALRHVVPTPGWISADLHVHASPSKDSYAPMPLRIKQALTEGLDMLVATDHRRVTDYRKTIAALGVTGKVATSAGIELSTSTGHFAAFPMPITKQSQEDAKIEARTVAHVLEQMRAASPGGVIIAAHPNAKHAGYFLTKKLDAKNDRAKKGFSYNFDAFELVNSLRSDWTKVPAAMRQWFQLLDRGHLITAVGGSDAHRPYGWNGRTAYPRNYIRVPNADPATVSGLDVAKAIKAGRVVVTTGPVIDVRAGNRGIGDVVPAPGGIARLELEVRAAPWVSVSRVIIYVNGVADEIHAVAPSTDPVRLRHTVHLAVDTDAYVVVYVAGDRDLRPVVGEGGRRVPSLAITNPIYLDRDGNGRYDPRKPHGRHAPPSK